MQDKQIPVLFETEQDCCGCGACRDICSVEAITMIVDKSGFYYPKIDQEKCVCCYRCISVCSWKK